MADALPFGVGGPAEQAVDVPPLVGNLVAGLLGIPKHLMETSANAVPGLRKEDVTDNPTAPEPNKPLYDAAGGAALSLAGVGTPLAASGAAGIFGGKLAQTADIRALIEANKMREGGKSAGSIWGDTGWMKNPADNKWLFEIPDHKSTVSTHGAVNLSADGDWMGGPASAIINHPDLYQAYPTLKGVQTYVTASRTPRGEYNNPSMPFYSGNAQIHTEGPNLDAIRSIGLHEMQHAVQHIENFAPGGNPRDIALLQEKSPAKLPVFAQQSDPYDVYRNLAGEVQARNVQERADYHPLHRQIVPPWETMDTPIHEQLVRHPNTDLIKALRGYSIK